MTMQNTLKNQIENIKSADEFFKIIKNFPSRTPDTSLKMFTAFFKHIPDKFLYDIYKEILCDKRRFKFHTQLFSPTVCDKINSVKKNDENLAPTLKQLADSDGYLTVYRGHTRQSSRTASSWTLRIATAHWFGKRHALLSGEDKYYILSGKVKADDVLAYITRMNEDEIVVMSKYVIGKQREYFDFT